ncbi:MAG: hypothetical protein U1D30_02490 [Planctomycetota bacterium]
MSRISSRPRETRIAGEGSTLAAGDTTVGSDGIGTIEVKEGARASVRSLTLGRNHNSQGTVYLSNEGSLLDIADSLEITRSEGRSPTT